VRRLRVFSTRGAAVALFAGLIAGCGASAGARPDPKPVSTPLIHYHPTPPRLPAGHTPGTLYVVDLTNVGAVKPAKVAFASDATLLHVQWSSWGGSAAVGHGTAVVRLCQPDCATGRIVPYPATVKLSGVKSCDHARFYVDSSVVADTRRGPWHLGSFMRNPCDYGH
jgi:hypothetical protein